MDKLSENKPHIQLKKNKVKKLEVPSNDDEFDEDEIEDQRLKKLLEKVKALSHLLENGLKPSEGQTQKGRKRKVLTELENISPDAPTTHGKQKDYEKVVQYDGTPDYINGEMRDYQIVGLNWLISICENGINGILADEMGLGKTIQTISILGYLKNVKNLDGPFLVVAPLSTIYNWQNEVKRFCPSLTEFVFHGSALERREFARKMKFHQSDWDLCITTYEVIKIEVRSFVRLNWQYVVLDEGHLIKSEKTKSSMCLRQIKSAHRLLLSGTPIQNNLHELWSLLNYLLPEMFSSGKEFDTWFDSDECLSGKQNVVEHMKKLLKPFMLRRVKLDVESTLLPKKEIKLHVPMTPLQYQTYKDVLQKNIKKINALGEVQMSVIMSILMDLRKASNHPYLIDGIEPGPPYTTDQHLVDSCGKMRILDQLLASLKAKGSRVVLFSQFKIVLNIIEDYLDWKGYKYLRLDGSVQIKQRQADIGAFNEENSNTFIFLMTTRAGGLGINLVAADTVIIYDSDWNPQSDFQAIDRVHRIGQKKQVHVFRLITENTVDHRMVHRAEIKQRLDNVVIGKGGMGKSENNKTPGKETFIDIIRYGADQILAKDESHGNYDLNKILQECAKKEAEDKTVVDSMTLETISSTSVYQFEGVDFRKGSQSASEAPSSVSK